MQRLYVVLNPSPIVGLLLALALVRCGDDSASAAQCDAWSRQASLGRRTEQDEAGRECSENTDCKVVDYELSCFADCGYPSAVASSSIPGLESAIKALDKANCDRFDAAACPGPIIPPCVAPAGTPSAVCRSGLCTLEFIPF
jgi:hypothetical protein